MECQMSKKRNNFRNTWASQSEIGKRFGISAIALGKILIAQGLRDQKGIATEKALADDWCKSTPLKTGEPFFMWHIEKVSELIKSNGSRPLSPAEITANEVISMIKSAEKEIDNGNDKIGYLTLDFAFQEIPGNQKEKVYAILKQKGYEQYLE